jgi:hypothetical protein
VRGAHYGVHHDHNSPEKPMADKADQALKLAQKNEKDLKGLEDLLRKVEKNLVDALNEKEKSSRSSTTIKQNE